MSSTTSKCFIIDDGDIAILAESVRRPSNRPHFEAWRCPPYSGHSKEREFCRQRKTAPKDGSPGKYADYISIYASAGGFLKGYFAW
jgi:hypothetical protein